MYLCNLQAMPPEALVPPFLLSEILSPCDEDQSGLLGKEMALEIETLNM